MLKKRRESCGGIPSFLKINEHRLRFLRFSIGILYTAKCRFPDGPVCTTLLHTVVLLGNPLHRVRVVNAGCWAGLFLGDLRQPIRELVHDAKSLVKKRWLLKTIWELLLDERRLILHVYRIKYKNHDFSNFSSLSRGDFSKIHKISEKLVIFRKTTSEKLWKLLKISIFTFNPINIEYKSTLTE